MDENRNEKKPGNPWTRSLLIWLAVLFGLVLFVRAFDRYSVRIIVSSFEYAGTTASRITVAASARSAVWSAAGTDGGNCMNGPKSGFVESALVYGTIVWSLPTTDTRGTVNPRASPARMFTICSSKYRGTSRSRAR